MNPDPRAAAAAVLGDVLAGRSLDRALGPRLESVAARDRGLVSEICYGALRAAPRLRALLALLLEKPLRDRDRDIEGLLLAGLYQLDSMRVPDHAAVAATVQAATALKKHWARGLINAVLRRYLRERGSLAAQLGAAAAAAHPQWLYELLGSQWPDALAGIVEAGNGPPPMTLRVNAARGTREAYLDTLRAQGIGARAGSLAASAVYLSEPMDVRALPGFTDGLVSVQDEAAQLAAPLLDSRPGERVLDACAAPGGKACHLLELQPGLAELVAMDCDAARLERVRENLRRLDLGASVIEGDASDPPPGLSPASFDRILVDAPCSASGVIRRHPDIKLLRRAADIAALAERQLAILQGLWPLLRPGGTLLYATCSVLEEENIRVVRQFTAREDSARTVTVDAAWGRAVDSARQVLPARDGPDGLFYAVLRKTG